jgi:hypothetical protein
MIGAENGDIIGIFILDKVDVLEDRVLICAGTGSIK